MTYYAPPDQVDQLAYSAKIGKEIMTFFEGYYSIPYPLPKAGMCLVLMLLLLSSLYCRAIQLPLVCLHLFCTIITHPLLREITLQSRRGVAIARGMEDSESKYVGLQ